jgi:hypothetical protein
MLRAFGPCSRFRAKVPLIRFAYEWGTLRAVEIESLSG